MQTSPIEKQESIRCSMIINISEIVLVQFVTIQYTIWIIIVFNFFTDSIAYEKMCSTLINKRLKKGIMKASPIEQTSCLEGFHSVLNQFSPKMIGYSYREMFCRYVLYRYTHTVNSLSPPPPPHRHF